MGAVSRPGRDGPKIAHRFSGGLRSSPPLISPGGTAEKTLVLRSFIRPSGTLNSARADFPGLKPRAIFTPPLRGSSHPHRLSFELSGSRDRFGPRTPDGARGPFVRTRTAWWRGFVFVLTNEALSGSPVLDFGKTPSRRGGQTHSAPRPVVAPPVPPPRPHFAYLISHFPVRDVRIRRFQVAFKFGNQVGTPEGKSAMFEIRSSDFFGFRIWNFGFPSRKAWLRGGFEPPTFGL